MKKEGNADSGGKKRKGGGREGTKYSIAVPSQNRGSLAANKVKWASRQGSVAPGHFYRYIYLAQVHCYKLHTCVHT